MAIVMHLRWEGITPEQYDQAREHVAWETDAPKGAVFHVASFSGGGIDVTDVWESAEEFQAFADQRLLPALKGKLGFPGEPVVTVEPAYRVFDAKRAAAWS
jgi:hypothetical protein